MGVGVGVRVGVGVPGGGVGEVWCFGWGRGSWWWRSSRIKNMSSSDRFLLKPSRDDRTNLHFSKWKSLKGTRLFWRGGGGVEGGGAGKGWRGRGWGGGGHVCF